MIDWWKIPAEIVSMDDIWSDITLDESINIQHEVNLAMDEDWLSKAKMLNKLIADVSLTSGEDIESKLTGTA